MVHLSALSLLCYLRPHYTSGNIATRVYNTHIYNTHIPPCHCTATISINIVCDNNAQPRLLFSGSFLWRVDLSMYSLSNAAWINLICPKLVLQLCVLFALLFPVLLVVEDDNRSVSVCYHTAYTIRPQSTHHTLSFEPHHIQFRSVFTSLRSPQQQPAIQAYCVH